mmetsp:Transcript_22226/g.41685  ORF Transcript_22226/g.41685 Transcript_22226/m.41685 type:complete len:294 (+) Transcript_22226:211-1092(+)
MATPAQGEVLHSNDSKSLWNYTLSPGWTVHEVEVFRIALMKFGLGRWSKIVESRCLPGKTVAQLNNQAQRLIGQQSTSEFTGLHIDPSLVFAANATKTGMRKNGCLINTNDNPTREAINRKRKHNKEKYGLSQEAINALVIPVLKQSETSSVLIKSTFNLKDKANWRREQYDRLRSLQAQLARLETALSKRGIDVNEPQAAESKPTKTKAKSKALPKTKVTPKPSATAKAKTVASKRKVKTQEQLDMEMAMRLQMEEEGAEGIEIIDSDDDDFEVPSSKRRRASGRSRRAAAR